MTVLDDASLPTAVGVVEIRRGGTDSPVPVVYLHSAQGEGAAMAFLEALAETRRVVAPVFPGFGASEGLEAIDDIEDASFHVLDVLDRLDFAQVDLIGLSLGGWMAAELATRWPDRVRRVVLVNAVGLYVDGAPIKEIFGRPLDELAVDLYADPDHPVAQMMRALAQSEGSVDQIPFDLLRPVIQAQAATAKLGWNPYLHNPKLRRRLDRISAPALVVHGEHDGIVPRAHAEAYAAGIPDARLVDLEGAAHMATLERPGAVADLVLGHLTG
ncbi:MAG TPA: alpha/beta fold hydrolase [Acidimicrobiales bacterium]|nr:alpha/beta fold hydrolase [Acidimicrobiales bacterium]